MMDDNDKLGAMFAVLEDQQAVVQSAIAGLAQERKAMEATINAMKNTSGALQKATGDAAARAVVESIGQAPKTAVAALDQAMAALDEAVGQMHDAGAWLTYKAVAAVAGIGLLMVLAMYVLGRFMMPSEADREELVQLRAEKAELEANIADLTKRGARIKLNTCGNRLCIEASSNQGKDQAGNPVPMGAWETVDGRKVALVIPRGY